ncbi:uncharacterized protein LOC131886761 isoform X2 [Tigriopus californicus]|uniref:uncharacterized protein LOC131886761 isoform X2 n=1 Tax=Tigriopus californicus TaxID=6832 RepID=UPI0027DA61FA|nr:uncharacterized protein LOC131886761 isoform X2 [Tigriopus californicus]XP_059091143.1 uncharacterized protein LOC131886761 isoform X2 [Tigriopus californicus]
MCCPHVHDPWSPIGHSEAYYPNGGLDYPPSNIRGYPNIWRGPPNSPVQWQKPYDSRMVWKSPWISMDAMKAINLERQIEINQAFAAPTHALEDYARHHYPELFRPKPSLPYDSGPVIDLTSVRAQNILGYPPRPTINVVASCERRYCYMSCRLRLLGGGRCTPGGCMCYFNHLDYNGAPGKRLYPDDNIWYELSTEEQSMILDVLREGRPRNPPPTGLPSAGGGPKTDRPPFGQDFYPQTINSWYGNNQNNAGPTKPPYRTTTGASIGGGWDWGPEETLPPPSARPPFDSDNNWFLPEKPVTNRPTMRPNPVTSRSSGGGSPFSDEDELGSNGSGDDDNDDDFSSFGDDDDFW